MQWLYVYFPRLQLDQFEVLQHNSAQTVVVVNNETNTVIQCSKAAVDAGIKAGMGLAEVSAMNDQTEVIVHSPLSEESQLAHLATTLYTIASDIVLCQPTGIAIKLTPLERYYQGLDNFIALCQQTLRSCHVTYQFGAGATIEIARVLAYVAINSLQPATCDAGALQKCPLTATQLCVKDIEQLQRVGVHTVGQLLQIPLDELGKRFNNKTIAYVLALGGIKQPCYDLFHPKQTFDHFLELPFAIEAAPRLLRYLSVLLQKLCTYLHHRNLATDSLGIVLTQRDDDRQLTINAGTPHPHFDEWLSLIDLHLETLRLDSPVTAIRLYSDTLTEFAPENLSLLDTVYSKHAENMLLGKLLARLGADSVYQPRTVNDHRLEFSFSGVATPTAESPLAPGHNKPQATTSASTMHQPGLLLPEARPLREETHIVYGPERLHTGWWDARSVKRDYFIAVTPQGQRLSVFRDEHQHWYVHGYFV
ncbi:Y-family DNA polymerase [Alteromonas gilva]|uniref:DNA polymerase Y family protein n=1 Tax=Alteromonas gilva TaxID=2987522 RepID=A0ABT5L5R3_9ALTE|nr:DNA polymerase Y family protein [Alteromonas gilva]MDC8831821.1 DNA polymerase Y family protein [Alteromonas gilva]